MRGCLIPHASLSSVCVWEKEGGRRNVAALGSDDRSVWRSRKVGDRQETLTSGNQVVMETTPTTKTGRRGGPIFHWPSQSSNHSLPKAPLTKKMQWDFQWKSSPLFCLKTEKKNVLHIPWVSSYVFPCQRVSCQLLVRSDLPAQEEGSLHI